MSIVTQALVVEKYGLRLCAKQIADVLGITMPALYNQLSAERCPITTYKEAGKVWADYRHVAAHIDGQFEAAGA